MAQMVLGAVGGAVGGGLGRAIGTSLGSLVDRAAVNALIPARQKGPRLEGLRLQSSAEGAPMAFVLGRARVAGQVIWAARFSERVTETGGGKAGVRTAEAAYALSFAVALCEGPIDGVGRVWADGQPMDLSGVTMRLHRGEADQMPDSLIEAVEGIAPAYRGTAYVVFEDLALGAYGNRPPQLSFEVFRRVGDGGLESELEGVCLIPGAGEFVLATEPVFRRDGLTKTTAENLHQTSGQSDLMLSIDQLAIAFPNLKRVSLVVGWFGDDLRAGACRVRPGVERRDKAAEPQTWAVAGLDRAGAHLVSGHDGAPAYGGTPSDESVRQAVAALKARGWAVTLYPFVFMDIAPGNGLPDPYGGVEQAAYPWRGRVRGRAGAEAQSDMDALFGTSTDWGLRRLAHHYARLVADTGADGLLIGSEMRGVTQTRDAMGGFPAVAALQALAAECREIVGPEVELSYAADWSEYGACQVLDGSGDVAFPLDTLWADPAIDYVGIDWYPPMGDWREGEGGLDAAQWSSPEEAGYLAGQVAGGEGYDWFYADAADRAAQVRTPVDDTAHGEDWIFRVKDLRGWWAHVHHPRIGGVRQSVPTGWQAGLKPIRLTEFGCAAVDRGANAPNLFQDPKSAESALPPHSTGARSDRMQRRTLEAVLSHYDQVENNPVSGLYGGAMLEGADAWCWDARPYPAFPAATDVWADAGAWRTGHWLNGRAGGEGAAILAALMRRGGLDDAEFEIGATPGLLTGCVIERPMRVRDAMEPVMAALGMTASEQGGKVALLGEAAPVMTLKAGDLALDEAGAGVVRARQLEPVPGMVRVRFIDEADDYQVGSQGVRAEVAGDAGAVDLDLPLVCDAGVARRLARRLLDQGRSVESLKVRLGPLEALRLEAGDRVCLEGLDDVWQIESLSFDEVRTANLTPVVAVTTGDLAEVRRRPGEARLGGAPFVRVLDLPPLMDAPQDGRMRAVVAADPWRPMRVWGGASSASLTVRGEVDRSATVGRLVSGLADGPKGRWDRVNALVVDLEGEAPTSRSDLQVLDGAGAVVVWTANGWEVVQYRQAELLGAGEGRVGRWRLSGLLRGQRGTEAQARAGAGAGAEVVVLNEALIHLSGTEIEAGLSRVWRAGPRIGSATGPETAEAPIPLSGPAGSVWARPWRPAHLRTVCGDEGLTARWIARSRLDIDGWADGWSGGGWMPDPERFRIRVLDGMDVRRTVEVEGCVFVYEPPQMVEDFPDGLPGSARLGVAQSDGRGGWGAEAVRALTVEGV